MTTANDATTSVDKNDRQEDTISELLRAKKQALAPQCLATTSSNGAWGVATGTSNEAVKAQASNRHGDSLFKDAQFSADGLAVVTLNVDNTIRTYAVPTDLQAHASDINAAPKHLVPYAVTSHPSPVQCYALYPGFDVSDASSTVILSSCIDQPIKLQNALYPDYTHASYPLIIPTTERFVAPSSLIFSSDGTHFITGSRNQIDVFDVGGTSKDPLRTHRTSGTSRQRDRKRAYGSMDQGPKGLVMALAVDAASATLAAGTERREIALFAAEGRAECVASFSIAAERVPGERREEGIGGNGVTGLSFSPDGTYLFIAERQSDGIQVYDIRNLGRRVSCLTGRKARTTQRLGFDVVPAINNNACQVWAGGTDGVVRLWKNAGKRIGMHEPELELQAHTNAVSAVRWQPEYGEVMVTCSGRKDDYGATNADASVEQDSSSEESDESDEIIVGNRGDAAVPALEEAGRSGVHTVKTPKGRQPRPDNTLKLWAG